MVKVSDANYFDIALANVCMNLEWMTVRDGEVEKALEEFVCIE